MQNDDDQKHNDQFDAALPLPIKDAGKSEPPKEEHKEQNTAADLIRKKVEEAYKNEPSAKVESEDLRESNGKHLTKHQKFIVELTNSGKPLHEIQIAWHEYYAALPDHEKHEVWNEFYRTHEANSQFHAFSEQKDLKKAEESRGKIKSIVPSQLTKPATASNIRGLEDIRSSLRRPRPIREARPQSPLHSLFFGLGVGCIAMVVFLFSFFNERFITPFIQPSRNFSDMQLITTGNTVSPKPELIIPKINVQIPIIYATDNSDNTIETDLESGVVHYADTAMPGQDGNLVIFGHSSNNIFNPGRYKFAFVLLKRLDPGDTFYIDYHSKRYTYEVFDKKIVSPKEVSVLDTVPGKDATATLITCDPPGTSINRLVVTANQIDPSPTGNTAALKTNAATETKAINGNGPTLWHRFIHWLWG